MRKLFVLLMCVLSAWLVWRASAQEPNAGVIFFQHRQFNIPFKNDPKNAGITLVRLYVSRDQGSTWQITATAAPDEKNFRFSTTQDGFFCFAVQTVDSQGKAFPPSVDDFRPTLKVIVDTIPPVVQLQALQPRNGEVGVAWLIRDDNLDTALPDAVQLQYRLAGGVTWIPVHIVPGSQQHYWNPQTNATVEVRVLARDRAGNVGENKTSVSLGGAGANQGLQNPLGGERPIEPFNAPKDAERKFVNSRQVTLGYDLRDVGPSGVSSLELWSMYYGGKSWNKLAEYRDLEQGKKLSFELPDEGVYGITLVAKSGVGLGERPPQAGDRPQFWIEVDLTKPIVQIQSIQVGTGVDKGKLTVNWSARDRNLGAKPIRLTYAEQREGPWTPCLAEKLPNLGRYVWSMPEALPYQFYLRIEAIDLAGNIGEAVTQDKVKVDLSLPKAKIIDIEPGAK